VPYQQLAGYISLFLHKTFFIEREARRKKFGKQFLEILETSFSIKFSVFCVRSLNVNNYSP
jgi:hypothetical protein